MRHRLHHARIALLGRTRVLMGPLHQHSVSNAVLAHILVHLAQFRWRTALVAVPVHILLLWVPVRLGRASIVAWAHGRRLGHLLAFHVLLESIHLYQEQHGLLLVSIVLLEHGHHLVRHHATIVALVLHPQLLVQRQ